LSVIVSGIITKLTNKPSVLSTMFSNSVKSLNDRNKSVLKTTISLQPSKTLKHWMTSPIGVRVVLMCNEYFCSFKKYPVNLEYRLMPDSDIFKV
jgi:hypothetical protein